MIEKLTEEQLKRLKKGCPVISGKTFKGAYDMNGRGEIPGGFEVDLGMFVNFVIDFANDIKSGSASGTPYEEFMFGISEDYPEYFASKNQFIEQLNSMCPLCELKLGDIIFGMFDAFYNSYESEFIKLPNISDDQVKALDGVCNTLKGVGLGSKLKEIVDLFKSIPAQSITLKSGATIDVGEGVWILYADVAANCFDVLPENASLIFGDITSSQGYVSQHEDGKSFEVNGASEDGILTFSKIEDYDGHSFGPFEIPFHIIE